VRPQLLPKIESEGMQLPPDLFQRRILGAGTAS
jgi:hypothetical protein